MSKYCLRITLKSDATFGRGDGIAGLIDVETQHDDYGFPYLGGRVIKGILVEECADILAALGHGQPENAPSHWQGAAKSLFGQPGSKSDDQAMLQIGDACLPADLREMVRLDINADSPRIRRDEVLETFTAVRKQTAIDESGVPKDHSLRVLRVIMRETVFEAELRLPEMENRRYALALLSACVAAFRRAGTGRNRGRGLLTAELFESLDGEEVPIGFDVLESDFKGVKA